MYAPIVAISGDRATHKICVGRPVALRSPPICTPECDIAALVHARPSTGEDYRSLLGQALDGGHNDTRRSTYYAKNNPAAATA
jgi:hypothetical protein